MNYARGVGVVMMLLRVLEKRVAAWTGVSSSLGWVQGVKNMMDVSGTRTRIVMFQCCSSVQLLSLTRTHILSLNLVI